MKPSDELVICSCLVEEKKKLFELNASMSIYIRFHLRCKFKFGFLFFYLNYKKCPTKILPHFSKTNHLKMRIVKHCGTEMALKLFFVCFKSQNKPRMVFSTL